MTPCSLKQIRQSALVLLAKAIHELCPDADLLGGKVTMTGFYYDLSGVEEVDRHFLTMAEEKMRGWIKEDLPFQHSEMVSSNAAQFFSHHCRRAQAADLADMDEQLVDLVRVDGFFDLAEQPPCPSAGTVPSFKLTDFKELQGGWRVYGTAHQSKDQLKKLVNALRKSQKQNHLVHGEALGWVVPIQEKSYCLLAGQGVKRKEDLLDQAARLLEEEGYLALDLPEEGGQALQEQEMALAASQYGAVYTKGRTQTHSPFDPQAGLLECPSPSYCRGVNPSTQEELAEKLKSSLKLIDKTCTILGLKGSWILFHSESSKKGDQALVKEMIKTLEEIGVNLTVEPRRGSGRCEVVVRAVDPLEREWDVASLQLVKQQAQHQTSKHENEPGKTKSELIVVTPIISAERLVALELEQQCQGL